MTDHITALAGTMVALARAGGTKLVNGITTSAVTSGVVQVDLGAGRIVPAKVPGSFRANVVTGQKIRLTVSGNAYTVESVLTALTTPTVAAPPSANGTTSVGPSNFAPAGFDNTGFTLQDFENADFADYIAAYVRGLSDDVNELRTTCNNLRTTVAALRTTLIAQGHAV